MAIDIGELAGAFAHGAPDEGTVNRLFGELHDRHQVNLQLVWDELVEDDGFTGDWEIFVVEGPVAYHLTPSVTEWLTCEHATHPGDPSEWKGQRADFNPVMLIGDGGHNLAHRDSLG
ncbi:MULTISPECIES: hypothetical protein [Mycolicibacter]|uniref:Uncharacterized protein n=2 Tax=Mycolicibacter TaxID=1073531 RepID=A0ABU5XLI4_9MYCO|nr:MULTISPECIES: hypothetical protein [unclassified Mycolicibacter]MEB3023038.1 hypothetical protein [Mycolicibacter sp. MYC098]MEB3033548.1 hypothetical protein [Mycolicibacter sp. MYC340]